MKALIKRYLARLVDDTTNVQRVQAEHAGERTADKVEVFWPHGIRFVPPKNAVGLFIPVAGQTSNAVALPPHDPDSHPPLGSADGEGGLYLPGSYRVFLAASGVVVLAGDTDSGRGASDAPAVDSKVQTELAALRTKLNDLITKYNAHIHITTATIGASGTPGVINPTTSIETPPAAVGATASTKVKIPSD